MGQPIVVGRNGLITAVRVAMLDGVNFSVDVVRVHQSVRDIGATPADAPGGYTCTAARWEDDGSDAWVSGEGVGRVVCPSALEPCNTPIEFTTIPLSPPLEVTDDDVVYMIVQFEEDDWQRSPLFTGLDVYPRRATNAGGTLVFETLVASCE